MKSTLAKKMTTKFLKIFLDIFINFLFYFICNFFQSCYLIFHTQKVATHCKEQNKKRIMTIGSKTKKLFNVKKDKKNGQKT